MLESRFSLIREWLTLDVRSTEGQFGCLYTDQVDLTPVVEYQGVAIDNFGDSGRATRDQHVRGNCGTANDQQEQRCKLTQPHDDTLSRSGLCPRFGPLEINVGFRN